MRTSIWVSLTSFFLSTYFHYSHTWPRFPEILEDVSSEVKKFGRVSEVVMPRPLAGQDIKGVGKIFIRYEKPEEASAAVKMLAGRRFADRTVIAGFYDVERFRNGDY